MVCIVNGGKNWKNNQVNSFFGTIEKENVERLRNKRERAYDKD